ncbi:MAG: RNA methyltransferase [Planctomycetaceae bacterium]
MAEFPYLTANGLLERTTTQSIIVVLDRIQDPYNFGAIIRSAEGLGLEGMVIGTREQSAVNSLAARGSAGAVNHLPICRVDDLAGFVRELRQQQWQVWGASEKGSTPLSAMSWELPLAVIIGNEGVGISPEVLSLCTQIVQIPMLGRVGSLNAAVSAGILCYEAAESRRRLTSGT